eukprot:CAMPEP_0168416138 /NCGR_PEP_ID=MMETSP0228-20121227/30590_1 /TAXON_ID=133427 /ORGANISM="Protoceratium reticulatum, Strain CCCM 535 (=CCMP 1889)" /LENGTH=145 /DNA_ID=CAMNT_0008429963 /DNA_START=216 /DNA_END=649 /DNA_ORIENTATION=-
MACVRTTVKRNTAGAFALGSRSCRPLLRAAARPLQWTAQPACQAASPQAAAPALSARRRASFRTRTPQTGVKAFRLPYSRLPRPDVAQPHGDLASPGPSRAAAAGSRCRTPAAAVALAEASASAAAAAPPASAGRALGGRFAARG